MAIEIKKSKYDTIEDSQLLGEIRYLDPADELPKYSDYPLSLLTPILARHMNPSDPVFIGGKPHKHCEFEFTTVLKGSVTVHLGNFSLHIKAGDGICIKRGVPHMFEPDSEKKMELEVIHFHHALLFGTTLTMLTNRNLAGILSNKDFDYTIFDHTLAEHKAILNRAHDVYKYMHSEEHGGEMRAISAIFDIWGMYVAMQTEIVDIPLTKQQALDNMRIEKAMEYISEHYAEDILLSDISEVCDVSDSECCRTFQRALHSSPIDYINRYRVYAAAEFLTNDVRNTPMSDIALMVGFNYASYFNKTFKRYIGITPMQYRKKYNKGELYRKSQQEFRI
jgi:AraC-like DNA-binding protein